MQRLPTFWVFLVLTATALSGCAGKDTGGGGNGEPDAATLSGTGYDRAIGNQGFRVTGSLKGPATPLFEGSAISVDALDIAANDANGAKDKATVFLDANETAFHVLANLKTMVTKVEAKGSGDHFSGVGRNVDVFGATGVGPADLPQTKAYLFVAGTAAIKIGTGSAQSGRLVYVAVTPALRDAAQAPLAAPDPKNVQIHVIFPGKLVTGGVPITGVPEEFLYYYFETVGVQKLSDAEKADIGKGLVGPEVPNVPPVAAGTILVAGKVATSATQEGNASVKVTFDGSASTDADGAISTWVWRVNELTTVNGTAVYRTPEKDKPVVTGKTVEYEFTSPGPKLVELSVSDNRNSSKLTLNFYVNYHRAAQEGGGSLHSQTVGGGPACQDAVNCFKNTTTIEAGVVTATYKTKQNGGTISGWHIEIYAPGKVVGTDAALKTTATDTLTVSAADFKGVTGRYTLLVWYQASASAGGRDSNPDTKEGIYDIESTITYAPSVT